MADVLTARQRSYCMSQIRGKDTKPEHFVRSGLFALGFRYRLHRRDLPGCPDIVLPKHRAVVFVHGCLWHGHECHLFKWPKTNPEFWRRKISRNREIDALAVDQLRIAGWRIMTIWECAIKGRARLKPPKLFERMARWLLSGRQRSEIAGRSVVQQPIEWSAADRPEGSSRRFPY